jgi:phosphinothricin acetyltransferase
MNAEPKTAPVVRPARPSDASGCVEIYAPFVFHTPVSFETKVPTEEEFARRIEDTMRVHPWLVAESEGALVAYAYACRHRQRPAYRWSVEVSAYVARGCRRRGIGRALYSQLLDLLTKQGFANAYAGIALPNDVSVAFHEAMGFEPVGVYRKVGFKLGRWHDVGWWSLRLSDGVAPPVDPVPYEELRRRDAR